MILTDNCRLHTLSYGYNTTTHTQLEHNGHFLSLTFSLTLLHYLHQPQTSEVA